MLLLLPGTPRLREYFVPMMNRFVALFACFLFSFHIVLEEVKPQHRYEPLHAQTCPCPIHSGRAEAEECQIKPQTALDDLWLGTIKENPSLYLTLVEHYKERARAPPSVA